MPKEEEEEAAGSVDPLSGLGGLSLFPRTIRSSAEAPVPSDSMDLDFIHNFMKSLKELRSPEKLVSEAKKIVDGGADLLSNLSSYAISVGVTNDNAAKAKDKPQERRPGLGLARKKASFSLKPSISHPPVNLEPVLDMDSLQDPDAFFDAYERTENAKKEMQKQLGVSVENIGLYKPSNNERRRRPGILGKSYNYKHRYSSTPSENDDMWISSQETVSQDIPSPPKDVLQEKIIDPDPDPNLSDVEEDSTELAGPSASMKKTEGGDNAMLEELLSCNDDDLEGEGALNILQERLKIKTLDMEKLCFLTELPDVRMASVLTTPRSRQRPRRSSVVLDSVLKNLNKKPRMGQEQVENPANHVSSPTPPRNPFGSVSLLKKKILQPSPLRDPFSPQEIDLCPHPNSSSANPTDELLGQVDIQKDLGHELESHVKFGRTESAISDIYSPQVLQNAGSLPEQSESENASMQRECGSTKEHASPGQLRDKLVGQADVHKELGMFNEMESNKELNSTNLTVCDLDEHQVNVNADGLAEQFGDENASIPSMDASSRQNEEPDNSIGETMNTNHNESNPSVDDKEGKGDASSKRQINPEQHKVHAAKPKRGKRVAGDKRIRDAHPMRKSIADAGTSFETGVRRSKRVRTRPLEYWKGERFLYERVEDSLKLIGLKYISPGKGNEHLKVKPYILSEKVEYKELLDLAARH
ncbi:centromere protein C-like isoform X2 [Salvia splendens]|uniref:centromere protein C-like isoform X2 n=1 Tax=Salvia splendens TaxID=180675 RepID=UPI001C2691E6|nr:centromere protein C-like isoform X2 [Salvia splendens]